MSTIVIGGGLAGLTAAAVLAEQGESVTVLERRGSLGGRATTDEREGHLVNQGPHAMYLAGEGLAVLRRLGIDPPGGTPSTKGSLAVAGGRIGLLPIGARTLLRTPWSSGTGRIELGKALASLPRIDAAALGGMSMTSWLESTFRAEANRALVAGLARVTTYAADLDRLSADVGVAQLQLGLKGVRYVDGGWQSIVDRLAERAAAAGAVIRAGAAVEGVRVSGRESENRVAVETAEGTEEADQVVVAVSSPSLAARLTGSEALAEWAASVVPIHAATLDVGLRHLPVPDHRFAYSIDRPLYYSVHNPPADLGTGVTLHVMRYLMPDEAAVGSGEGNEQEIRAELESLLDLLQPGWRGELDTIRFQRSLVVSNATPTPETGGAAGRFPVVVPDVPGVFVAGDWVGPTGHLADASLSSAVTAAKAVIGAKMVAA